MIILTFKVIDLLGKFCGKNNSQQTETKNSILAVKKFIQECLENGDKTILIEELFILPLLKNLRKFYFAP